MKSNHFLKLMMATVIAAGIALQGCEMVPERGCFEQKNEVHKRDSVKNNGRTEYVITTYANMPIYYRTFTDSTGNLPGTTVTVIKKPQHGVLTPINLNTGQRIFSYMPDLNYAGIDHFVLGVCTPSGGCSTRRVSVNVIPVPANDSTPTVTTR